MARFSRLRNKQQHPMDGGPGLMDRSILSQWTALPLRLIVGYGFVAHGYAKLARGPVVFIDILGAIGVPAAHFMAWMVILIELVCGLAVLAGALIPLVSIPMAIVLLVAIFTVHLPNGFSSIKLIAVTANDPVFGQPGYECDLLYLACLAALVLGGAGPWSMDGALIKWWSRRKTGYPRCS
jgi:putative oxidoreductase